MQEPMYRVRLCERIDGGLVPVADFAKHLDAAMFNCDHMERRGFMLEELQLINGRWLNEVERQALAEAEG